MKVFLLIIFGVFSSQQQSYPKQLVIRKDIFNLFKANEFSVYDQREQQLLYRVETQLNLLHRATIVASQAGNRIVARISGEFQWALYQATFQLLNPQTNQWQEGYIREQFQWFYSKYLVGYQQQTFIFEGRSLISMRWYDQRGNIIVGEYRRRFELALSSVYDLSIYDQRLPDPFYLIGLAVQQRKTEKKNN
ncbi:unnamed protein product [Didymodactylos carnosus]|uniref:Uncharacterized protein n=1 Tax=Didymodactylos carnosus TaxID=1234261 RepID=A0A814YEW9_9BILA|nr:unnamed protein product [Didymodactylos carnosus]CAF1535131.1 unnamed protein product [Didymodactylos carnosus]CAF3991621.1 unnamed protein product [Didymodactylos carnosus]CAF4322623.1 unnamed protein product [Didymodactylos carnosus]